MANAARRIIHVRDWHYVPRDLYALELRHAAGRPLTDGEVDAHFRDLLRDANAVKRDQELVLGALATRHGLRRVLVEGLTPGWEANYRPAEPGSTRGRPTWTAGSRR